MIWIQGFFEVAKVLVLYAGGPAGSETLNQDEPLLTKLESPVSRPKATHYISNNPKIIKFFDLMY